MIAKALVWFLLLIILPDMFIWFRFLRKKCWWVQTLWFVPCLLFVTATVLLSLERDFVPDDMTWLNVYLIAIGLLVAPKLIFAVGSLFGKKGRLVSLALAPVVWFVVLYGSFVGNQRLEVKRVELSFTDLPQSFDGYRIVQFTDIHLGSMDAAFLQEVVDSINAQKADMVAFTGDIQNKMPSEIKPFMKQLKKIKSKDGVFSVMGNHDYVYYIDDDTPPPVRYANERQLVRLQQDLGWQLLLNSYRVVKHGGDSIIVSGLENDGENRFPQEGNINQALAGVARNEFIVMMEHDPSAWKRKILRECHAQLTLSGHTHGMQFELFGWSPLSLLRKENDGLYRMGSRCLYVSKGVGGVVPFRFGATPEIVVITLRKQ